MKRESIWQRSQLKGYIFEIIIMELLMKNNFSKIDANKEPRERVRENRAGFIEFKGRGCWHQIDCPCDYSELIPFSYPLRLLGEVKYHKAPVDKKYMREYIGVIKDIQENYFVSDGMNLQNFYPRKTEIGAYFSASGFQEEAEKLAYAHGIKTVSYKNNYIINKIKLLIDELEEKYLSIRCMRENNWNNFRNDFINLISDEETYIEPQSARFFADGYMAVIENIRLTLAQIATSFIATTATGVFIHFVGDSYFPEEVFRESDEGHCRVYYNYDESENRYFWLEISGDEEKRKFYFTPPETLDQASIFGKETVLNEKERLFRVLNVNIKLNGISRSLTLHLDGDWLTAIRNYR